ncbi:MAG: 7TM diverse intracellular signaling domain-containing protein [Burkholderiaceae bacterium]|nr:7TM diverse intracellular signaling domain-containing protein [Burkholderiaceae bacterium]
MPHLSLSSLIFPARLAKLACLALLVFLTLPLRADHPQPNTLIALQRDTMEINLDGHSRMWVDETGQASLAEAEARAVTGEGYHLRRPYERHTLTDRALWVTFDAVLRDDSFRWLLEVALPGVDRVSVYYRDANSRWVEQVAGDSVAVEGWPLPDRFPIFLLSDNLDRTVRYFVKIEHARVPFSAPLTLYSHRALLTQREIEHMFIGAYFGLLLLVMVLAIANMVAYRDSAFGAFAVYIFFLALTQSSYMGLSGQYLWPGSPHWSHTAGFLLAAFSSSAALLYVRRVTAPAQYSDMLDRALIMWVVLNLANAFIDAFSPSKIGFILGSTFLAGTVVLVYITCWFLWRGGNPHGRMLALGFLPVLVAAQFPILRNFGVVPMNLLAAYSVAIGTTFSAPILLYLMGRRTAQRREAQVRARALLQTDPLTGLTNQRILLIRLHDALVRAQRFKHRCALLVINLSNHADFADEYGRETAERALVLAASRIRGNAREIDTVARVGETKFALLIEGPANPGMAAAAATQVVARGLRPSNVLPVGTTLKFHVAAAVLPDPEHEFGHDAQAFLDWLAEVTGSMTQDPRQSIRTLNF